MTPEPLLVRVYGDSLSLPRVSEGVAAGATYPELFCRELRRRRPERDVILFNRARGAGTVTTLVADYLRDAGYFGNPGADRLVIQCGICDCAPRPLPPAMRGLVARLPGRLRQGVVGLLHEHRPRLVSFGPVWRETRPSSFHRTYAYWLGLAVRECVRVYAVNIAPVTDSLEAHSPGLRASIALYNRLIGEAVDALGSKSLVLLDAHAAISARPRGIEACINANDGHHLTAEGHRLYSELVLEREGATES